MNPPVFETLNAVEALKPYLGEIPFRVLPFGNADQKTKRPYVTYGGVDMAPENYLDRVPNYDRMGTQVDVWAESGVECEEIAILVRNALEPVGHMTRFTVAEVEQQTQLHRISMDFDFWTAR